MEQDKIFLKKAIEQAKKSLDKEGFPAGAVLVKDGSIISEGISIGNLLNDPTEHSETSAIKKACKKLATTDLSNCVLYCTLQPCLMCFSTANWAQISKIVYGCQKTDEMTNKNYYEGLNKLEEINEKNNHHIELQFISDFENEILDIIRTWENKNN